MTIYATFDAEGFPTGFYPDGVYMPDVDSGSRDPRIPDTAIEITDEQWKEFIENPGLRRWGGEAVFVHTPSIDMEAARKAAHAEAWRYGEAIIARELGNWTSAEQLSWDLQKSESQIVVAGGTLTADALIPGLAEDKGVTLEDYAVSVLLYAERFQQITRAAIKLRREVGVLLSEDLDTPAKLDAAVAELKTQADTIAAALIGAPE